MTQAARLGDSIGHSPSMSWLLRGLLIGAGIALAGVAIVGTGGLAAAAIIGGAAAAGAGLGELLSTMSWAPKEVCGFIVGACSANVFTNGIKAARAHADLVNCHKHSTPHPPIATGSATVFINGLPAARIGDQIACGAVITGGSPNVFIGGGSLQTDSISPEDLVPGWIHVGLFLVGAASAVALAGPVIAIGGLVGGAIGGKVGELIGGRTFGPGSDGQKWSMLAGSLLGGIAGAKGAPKTWEFANRTMLVGADSETSTSTTTNSISQEINVRLREEIEMGEIATNAVSRSAAAEASSTLQGAKLHKHLGQLQKYGEEGYKELQNGRIRYYGEFTPARTPGEMVGARLVREWDPNQGTTRTWYETLDRAGNIRSVAPKPVTEPLNHRIFDIDGNYVGRR